MSELLKFIQSKPRVSYHEVNKKKFERLGRNFLKQVQEELGKASQIRMRYNPAGIACSGDHSLYVMFKDEIGACMFFNLDFDETVCFRSIKSINDYSGGMNHHYSMSDVFSSSERATEVLKACATASRKQTVQESV